jgi:hypothetical protein
MTTELVLPEKRLVLSELSFLKQLGRIQDGRVSLERSAKGYHLKKQITFNLDLVLTLPQKSIAEYIVNSLISQRPSLIPWVLENRSLVELANHMLRAGSGSKMGFYGYTNTVSLYCRRLKTTPDKLIADVMPEGLPVPARIEKHRTFLQNCINELQDTKRSPGRVHGYSRQIRTFYRVNGVELLKPKYLPKPKVVSKDRAPTPEELQRVLDVSDLRGRVIVTITSLGGFREGTLARLTYHHIKEDLEKGIVPLHIHVDAEETKGQYCDYDTFLNGEAVNYLKLYLDERRNGSPFRKDTATAPSRQKIPPEEIHDNSPLIRDSLSPQPRPIGEKQIYKLTHNLFYAAGLGKKNKNGGYELRVHSLRKFFKTQLKARGVDSDYVNFMMGHVVDTYHDIESKGIEFLRNLYAKADLRIRPKPDNGNVARFKKMVMEMARELNVDPEQVLARDALAEPHRIFTTPDEQDHLEIRVLTKALVQGLKDYRSKSSLEDFPGRE